MSRCPRFNSSLAALRPWPFGPPLRGRAPRSEAGVRAASAQATPVGSSRLAVQLRPPVGAFACGHPACYVL